MSRKKHYYRKKRRKRTVPVLLALVVLILGIAGYGNGQADSISSALNTILTAASDLASGAEIQTAYAPSDVTEDLTVHFLDIGQGDCTLLTQDGHAMLIDAGDNDQGTKVQSYLEYLGISSLDYLVLTHPDADHIGGADVYCPWDVINHVDRLRGEPGAQPQSYWINTSGNDLVKRFVNRADKTTRDEMERLIAGESVEKEIRLELTYDEIDQSIDNLWSALFLIGYLTWVGKPVNSVYRLALPNRAVREIYITRIQEWSKEKEG